MTHKKPAFLKKSIEAPVSAQRAENPFPDIEFCARMRNDRKRDARFSEKLKSIIERGAVKASTDARYAPSLMTLRSMVKKGVPPEDMLGRIVLEVESGLWKLWLSASDIELRGVNYAKTEQRNVRLAPGISSTLFSPTPAFRTGVA
ncbi:MAG: hypothetical protein H7315_01965 [Herminiimonas sp.]|nr:hypothetical protein [Herminiimonas sp.]